MNLSTLWLETLIRVASQASEPIVAAARETVEELDRKANQTPNPFDNVLTSFLVALFGGKQAETPTATDAGGGSAGAGDYERE